MHRIAGMVWIGFMAIGVAAFLSESLEAKPFKTKKLASIRKDDDDSSNEFETKTKVPLVGEFTQVVGNNLIKLEGAGLVVGLAGTGDDAPPSPARTAVLEDMKRRGVAKPNQFLKSPNTAIVIVTAWLPPLIRKGEHFDVEVTVPNGSKVKSLNGGYLMETYLAERAMLPDHSVGEGHKYATAKGHILVTGAKKGQTDVASLLRRGRIVAGGESKTDRNLDLYLRNDYRSERESYRIAKAIGNRFFDYDSHGQRMPLAEAKTDQRIELKVLPKYRDNYPRYLEVIRKIAFRETEVAQHVRIRSLKEELLNPETASQAAIKLEAIGDRSIPALKGGLESPDIEVRFNAAMALAYLGDASGLDTLAEAARDEFAFRVFAYCAMASFDDSHPEVHVKLRDLMNEKSDETRYGAFLALTTLDKNDPFVRGRKINDQYNLHVLSTEGPPMVHLRNYKRAEVVLFGARQTVRTPLFARAGTRILVSARAGTDKVEVNKFELVGEDQKRVVSTRLEDVILAISELGGSFPDVAQFLIDANAQKNLEAHLEIDALPRAGRFYERKGTTPGGTGGPLHKRRIGDPNLAPNLFSIENDKSSSQQKEEESENHELAKSKGKRSKADLADAGDVPEKSKSLAKKKATKEATDSSDDAPARDADTTIESADSPQAQTRKVKQASAEFESGKPIVADPKSADDTASPAKTSRVRQAVHTDSADKKSKADADVAIDDPEEAPAQTPPPSRFRWLRFFRFGDGISGNKEP